MEVIIIEDEQIAADNLENIIKLVDPAIHVVAKIESVRNAIAWLSKNNCDLIFLDIQLSDGISFSIFDRVSIKTPVIFTTAFDRYAIRAFKLNSIDYLLKPIEMGELKQSIEKYKYLNKISVPNINEFVNAYRNRVQYQARFLVYAGQKICSVKTSDIAYFYVREGSVYITTIGGKHYDLDYTLDRLQQILDPSFFFRINRQVIVNIDSIEQMHTLSKSRLKLDLRPFPDMEMIVSFNHVHDFKNWLNR